METMFSRLIKRIAEAFSPRELQHLDPQQAGEIARDLGVSRGDLVAMEAAGANSASLLPERLHALHIDAGKLPVTDWAAFRDMQRVCSMCGSKWQCASDLSERPQDPAWEHYCPNVETIRGLRKK